MNENWQMWTMQASNAARQGRREEAKVHFQQALEEARQGSSPKDLYYTLCNFADLVLSLGEFEDGERLLAEATRLSFEHGDLGVLTAWITLQKLFVHQKRLPDIELLCQAVLADSFARYGNDHYRYRMDCMQVANSYGLYLSDMDRCRLIFGEVIEWAQRQDDKTVLSTVCGHYDLVLRTMGFEEEANAFRDRNKNR